MSCSRFAHMRTDSDASPRHSSDSRKPMAIVSRARACGALLLASTFALQACDGHRVDGPPPVTVSLAKAAANPSVSAANPASGHQGDVTLDVTITGSGF